MAKSRKATATVETPQGEIKVPVEEFHSGVLALQTPAILSAEDKAKQEVQKFNVARRWIADRKKEYSGLTIAGQDDKEGKNRIHKAWQEIRGKRLAVADTHEELKKDYLVITRAIDKEKNELTSLLKEIEDPLKAELNRIENEAEELRKKQEQEEQLKLHSRVSVLQENGVSFNGSYYSIGATISIDVVTLKTFNDEQFDQLLDRVKTEHKSILDAQAARLKAEQDERDRIEQQRQDQERRQAELDRQAEELRHQKAEMDRQREQLAEEKMKSRAKQLEEKGFKYLFAAQSWEFRSSFFPEMIMVNKSVVYGMTDPSWDNFINTAVSPWVTKHIQAEADHQKAVAEKAESDRKEREQKEKEQREFLEKVTKRRGQLFSRNYHVDGKNFVHPLQIWDDKRFATFTPEMIESYDDEEWETNLKTSDVEIVELGQVKIKHRLQAQEKAEIDRLDQLSDVEKINEFLRDFATAAARKPAIKNQGIQLLFKNFDLGIYRLINELDSDLKKLGHI